VKNVSRHMISAPGTSCTQTEPWVEDTGWHGRDLYPAGVKWLNLIPPCGATTEDTFLAPGAHLLRGPIYVIASGPVLRAVMDIRENGSAQSYAPAMSPRLRLRLRRANPPRVRIRIQPHVLARVKPRYRSWRSPVFLSLEQCYPGTAPYDYLGVYWTPVSANVVRPECDHPLSWHAIVGWPGHSVAFIQYKR
jgi:hypothetical protein